MYILCIIIEDLIYLSIYIYIKMFASTPVRRPRRIQPGMSRNMTLTRVTLCKTMLFIYEICLTFCGLHLNGLSV